MSVNVCSLYFDLMQGKITLVLRNPDISCLASSAEPDQLTSEKDLYCFPFSVIIHSMEIMQKRLE